MTKTVYVIMTEFFRDIPNDAGGYDVPLIFERLKDAQANAQELRSQYKQQGLTLYDRKAPAGTAWDIDVFVVEREVIGSHA